MPQKARESKEKDGFQREKEARDSTTGCPDFMTVYDLVKEVFGLFPKISTKAFRAYRAAWKRMYPDEKVELLPIGWGVTRWSAFFMSLLRFMEVWLVIVSLVRRIPTHH